MRASTPQVETIGALKVAGHSIVSVDVAQSATIAGQLTASSLERLGQGTLLLRGIPTGAAPTAANSRAKVVLTAPPTGLIGGGGTGLATSILPYAIGDASLTGNGSGLVTYTSGVGLRLLDAAEYATAFGTPTSNVRLTASTALSQNQTVNALVLAGGSVTGSARVTVTSGVVLQAAATAATFAGYLEFGSRDGKIFTPGDLTIGGVITGSGGVTKSSDGTLTLTANNTFTGPLTINGGLVAFTSAAQLGSGASPIVIEGHNSGLSVTGAVNVTLARPITLASGLGRLRAQGASTFEVSGPISGPGGLRLGAFTTLRLTGSNTFTGPVFLTGGGTLEINSDAALGAGGELIFNSGTLKLLEVGFHESVWERLRCISARRRSGPGTRIGRSG